MLSQAQRTTILELSAKGVSKREIASVLKISRLTVRKVLRAKLNGRAGDPAGGESRAVFHEKDMAVRDQELALL